MTEWSAPWQCPCCRKCWIDLETGCCKFNGPFEGYEIMTTRVAPATEDMTDANESFPAAQGDIENVAPAEGRPEPTL